VRALGAANRVVSGDRVLAEAREIVDAISRMRSKSIAGILAAFNTHYQIGRDQIGLAEGKATELERYMEICEPQTFVAAVTALLERRRIDFTD
jgi:enoyl-CoA hydratase/carnithine racemase